MSPIMDLDGSPAKSSVPRNVSLADVAGTIIALITLVLPVFVIAFYSSTDAGLLQPPAYTLPKTLPETLPGTEK